MLSYLYRFRQLTALDERLIAALYDPGMSTGLHAVGALVVARRALATRHGLVAPGADAAHLPREVFDEYVKKLEKLAAEGNINAEVILYFAHRDGAHLPRDPEAAQKLIFAAGRPSGPILPEAGFLAVPQGTRFETASGGFLTVARGDAQSIHTINASDARASWIVGLVGQRTGSTVEWDKAQAIWPLRMGKDTSFIESTGSQKKSSWIEGARHRLGRHGRAPHRHLCD